MSQIFWKAGAFLLLAQIACKEAPKPIQKRTGAGDQTPETPYEPDKPTEPEDPGETIDGEAPIADPNQGPSEIPPMTSKAPLKPVLSPPTGHDSVDRPVPIQTTKPNSPCPTEGLCRIMPLGDSITLGQSSSQLGGYRVPLFEKIVSAKLNVTLVGPNTNGPGIVAGVDFPKGHAGYPGYPIEDCCGTQKGILPFVPKNLATYKPHIVLLMIGTNDIRYSHDLNNAGARISKLLDVINKEQPQAYVVIAEIIPFAIDEMDAKVKAFNQKVRAAAEAKIASGAKIKVVSMYDTFKAKSDWKIAYFPKDDKVHPNDAGYSAISGVFFDTIYPWVK